MSAVDIAFPLEIGERGRLGLDFTDRNASLSTRFAKAVQHWPGLYFELDRQHVIREVAGRALHRLAGDVEILGRSFLSLVPVADADTIQRHLETIAEVDEHNIRLTLNGCVGQVIDVEASLVSTVDDAGEPQILVFAQDISREVALRAEAAEARFLRQEIVGAISHGVLVARHPGKIRDANAAASRILGYAPSELRNLALQDVLAPSGEDTPMSLPMRESEGAFRGLVPLKRADGNRVEVDLSLTVVQGPTGGQMAVATFKDRSDFSRVESQRHCGKATMEALLAGDHRCAAESLLKTLHRAFGIERIGLYRVDLGAQSIDLLAGMSLPVPLARALKHFSLGDQHNPLVRAVLMSRPMSVFLQRGAEGFDWLDSTARLCGVDHLYWLPIGTPGCQVGAVMLMPRRHEREPDAATLEAETFLALAGVLMRLTSLEVEPQRLRETSPWLSKGSS